MFNRNNAFATLFFLLLSGLLINAFGQTNLVYNVKTQRSISSFSQKSGSNLTAIATNSKIIIYSLDKHKAVQEIKGNSTWVQFSADGKKLYSLAGGKKIIVFSTDSFVVTKSFPLTKSVQKAYLVNNDNQLLLLQNNGEVALINTHDGDYVYTKRIATAKVIDLSVAPALNLAALVDEKNQLYVFSFKEGVTLQQIEVSKQWVKSIALSPDGKYVITGGQEKKIDLWNVKSGTLDKTYHDIQYGWIYNLTFDGSGKYFAASSDDGMVVLYSVKDLTSKMVLNDFKYPVDQIYFAKGDTKLSTIEKDGKQVRIWDFYSGIKKDMAEEMSSEFAVVSDESDVIPPQVFITELANLATNKIVTKKSILDIHGVIMDESGVQSVTINGAKVNLTQNNKFTRYMLLTIGSNPVKIVATDGNQNVSVKEFEIYRKAENELDYDHKYAKNYLFVVGIDKYQHITPLNNAVSDAQQLTKVLQERYNFEADYTVTLYNEDATRDNMLKELRQLVKEISPTDNVIIYFAGHGIYDQVLDEGYWIPVDGEDGKASTYVSNSVLKKAIQNMNSQHVLVIADACFSGALFGNQKRGYLEKAEQFKSRYAFTSGRLEKVADGGVGQNSPFASLLIGYLTDNTKDQVMVSSIEQHIKENFPEESNQTPRFGPLRGVGDEGGEFIFYKR